MNPAIVLILLIPAILGMLYLWTHPMPDHSVLFSDLHEKKAVQLVEKKDKEHFFRHAPKASDADIPAGKHVQIHTDIGNILIELYPKAAPNTVANFKKLAGNGYYDGLTFYRMIPGLALMGGGPEKNGRGGPGYTIQDEVNSHKPQRGAVAMFLPKGPNSAGSQFFICYGPAPLLNKQDTVFGQVVKGMDVVERLPAGAVMRKVTVLP